MQFFFNIFISKGICKFFTTIVTMEIYKFAAKWLCKPFTFLVAPKLEYLYCLYPILKIAKRVYLLQSQDCGGFLNSNRLRQTQIVFSLSLSVFEKQMSYNSQNSIFFGHHRYLPSLIVHLWPFSATSTLHCVPGTGSLLE